MKTISIFLTTMVLILFTGSEVMAKLESEISITQVEQNLKYINECQVNLIHLERSLRNAGAMISLYGANSATITKMGEVNENIIKQFNRYKEFEIYLITRATLDGDDKEELARLNLDFFKDQLIAVEMEKQTAESSSVDETVKFVNGLFKKSYECKHLFDVMKEAFGYTPGFDMELLPDLHEDFNRFEDDG